MSEKKVRLKMGMHNPITKERFQVIKGALVGGMTREAVKKKYDIKDTTLNYIRRAETYYEYRLLTERLPHPKKMPPVYGPKSGLAFELTDIRPIFFPAKKVKPVDELRSNRLDRESVQSAYCLGLLILGSIGVIAIVMAFVLAMVK